MVGCRFMLYHILSARPAAEMTYLEGRSTNQLGLPFCMRLHLNSHTLTSFFFTLFFFLTHQRACEVFLLNILYATWHAERFIKKRSMCKYYRSFLNRGRCRCDVGLFAVLIYSTAESAAPCKMFNAVLYVWEMEGERECCFYQQTLPAHLHAQYNLLWGFSTFLSVWVCLGHFIYYIIDCGQSLWNFRSWSSQWLRTCYLVSCGNLRALTAVFHLVLETDGCLLLLYQVCYFVLGQLFDYVADDPHIAWFLAC